MATTQVRSSFLKLFLHKSCKKLLLLHLQYPSYPKPPQLWSWIMHSPSGWASDLTIFARAGSQLPCRTSQLILALQIYEELALKTLNIFIGEKLILHLILESFMSSSLSMGITHLAQMILQHRSIRLYKQKDTNAKLRGKIILFILKIIYKIKK